MSWQGDVDPAKEQKTFIWSIERKEKGHVHDFWCVRLVSIRSTHDPFLIRQRLTPCYFRSNRARPTKQHR
jgi:hypothetical protein